MEDGNMENNDSPVTKKLRTVMLLLYELALVSNLVYAWSQIFMKWKQEDEEQPSTSSSSDAHNEPKKASAGDDDGGEEKEDDFGVFAGSVVPQVYITPMKIYFALFSFSV